MRGFIPFPRVLVQVNARTQLAYFDPIVHYINHYMTGTLPTITVLPQE